MNNFGIIGVSIASQNLELLERLTIQLEERAVMLQALKTAADLSGLVYLATCNRVEFIFTYSEPTDLISVRNRILDLFFCGERRAKFEPNDFSLYSGLDGINHLFSVACALDSVMVGEAQILGQVKNALTFAQENDLADSNLDRLFQAAFRVAKKVRSDTELGKGNVSVVGLVTSLIRDFIKTEGNVPVALFGVGEMTRKVAAYLKDQGITEVVFVNRTEANTAPLVQQFGGIGISLGDFLANPQPVRIICSATSSPVPILTDHEMTELLNRVDNQKILAIDLAIPRDIELSEKLSSSDHVQLFNMSDIKQLSDTNRRQRFRDVDLARELIADEVDRFHHEIVENSLKSLFAESHREALDLAQKCLDDLFDKHLPNLADKDRKKIEYMLNKVVNFTAYRPVHMMAKQLAATKTSHCHACQFVKATADFPTGKLMEKLIIGSRGSDLALWQANFVRNNLAKSDHIEVEIKIIKTQGDKIDHLSFSDMEGKGFFTKELEDELLNGTIDLAVHSLKDLQTTMPEGLDLGAVCSREDPRELVLIRPDSYDTESPLGIKEGATIGTSSVRRQCQVASLAPTLKVKDLRGNVPTRINKLRDGQYDAILLAHAGVKRLNLNVSDLKTFLLGTSYFLPAPGQGILGIQIRRNDPRVLPLVAALDNAVLRNHVRLERGLLAKFEGGCQLPLAVISEKIYYGYILRAVLGIRQGAGWGMLRRVDLTGKDIDYMVTKAHKCLTEPDILSMETPPQP